VQRLSLTLIALALSAVAGCSGSSPGSPATSSGSAPASPTRPAPSPTVVAANWPTYHGSNDRAGSADGPVLAGRLRVAASVKVDGKVYAQPLVVNGLAIVATEHNTISAIRPGSGQVVWRVHLADPVPLSDLPCGNIDPTGITGTPAYDAATGLVFAATETTDSRHALVAIDARSGRVNWRRDLDVLPNRDRHTEQQRGALLVSSGRVYVPFGGRDGDCGNYVGYVVAIPTNGAGAEMHYAVPTRREAGMWAPPGPVVGPRGDIYVASGNGAEVGNRYDDSDSVIRLSATLQRTALFAPTTWPQDNQQDLDLGSMSPAVVGDQIVIAGKRGTVYLLDANLGGVGGELATLSGCAAYGGAAVRGNLVVLPCSDGLRALRVQNGKLAWLWHNGSTKGSPLIVGTDVYAFDGDDLVQMPLSTGKVRRRVHVGSVTRFTTPVPTGDAVLVATTSKLVTVVGS
jgi:outer membrane protein assembly factor BamB